MYSTETERKKPLWGRRRGSSLRGGGERLLTAINLILKTCNLQSNDAILIINVLVLDSVIGIKAKPRKQSGVVAGINFRTRNKLEVTFRETEKSRNFRMLLMH